MSLLVIVPVSYCYIYVETKIQFECDIGKRLTNFDVDLQETPNHAPEAAKLLPAPIKRVPTSMSALPSARPLPSASEGPSALTKSAQSALVIVQPSLPAPKATVAPAALSGDNE